MNYPQKISFGFYKVHKAAWFFIVERLSWTGTSIFLYTAPQKKSMPEYWRLLSMKLWASQSFFSCLRFCIKATWDLSPSVTLPPPQDNGCLRQPTHKSPLQKGLGSITFHPSLPPERGELTKQSRRLFSYWMRYSLWYPKEYANQLRRKGGFAPQVCNTFHYSHQCESLLHSCLWSSACPFLTQVHPRFCSSHVSFLYLKKPPNSPQ